MAASALVLSHKSHAADHLDSPTVKMAANQMADINDVYAWMTSDGAKVNLAMTVSPADMGVNTSDPRSSTCGMSAATPARSNAVAFGTPGTESRVICTFASNTSAECWVVQGTTVKDYVKGDPSTAMTSADGKMKVFAGRRSDPFFFNLAGFMNARGRESRARLACSTLRCRWLPDRSPRPRAAALRGALSSGSGRDDGPLRRQPDRLLHELQRDGDRRPSRQDRCSLQDTDHLLSVWGSTHAQP